MTRTTFHFLIHDRDNKFTEAFDTVLSLRRHENNPHSGTGAKCEFTRGKVWIRSVRSECLDKIIIVNPSTSALSADQIRNVLQYASTASRNWSAISDHSDCLKNAKVWCRNGQFLAESSTTTIAWPRSSFSRVARFFDQTLRDPLSGTSRGRRRRKKVPEQQLADISYWAISPPTRSRKYTSTILKIPIGL